MDNLDVSQILQKYQITIGNKSVCFIPLENNDELLILCSSMAPSPDQFNMLKRFVTHQKMNLLFIIDPITSYYLDEDMGQMFQKAIKDFTCKFETSKTFIFGTSSAGYAALYHGILLGINILASNPQINYPATCRSQPPGWSIAEIMKRHNFINIDSMIQDMTIRSVIYIVHGNHSLDISNIQEFKESMPKSMKLIIEQYDYLGHELRLTQPEHIYERLDIIKSIRNLKKDPTIE